ncbi:hypothetical protein Vadar_012586 [Vaccinium darrowii]|uniref:Uncharacterized protein n=1 Tax=Vaccinium darrowii TaxID=229202 RepID=A0ACB7YVW5_9ERIC|nr:hypothetical protein Vadar_012586 [Vaccinium darrowii]
MVRLRSAADGNDFINRRLTRSAFKRTSVSLENVPPQKKKLGFPKQKLGISTQKPGGLSKKIPGGLSKTDDKQQHDKQKPGLSETGDDNQQQPHREGKDVAEVRNSLTGEALREQQRERSKRWRNMTPEETESYFKTVLQSEGFDTVDLPKYIDYYGLIRPVNQSSEKQLVLEECSKSALVTFNEKYKTRYKFENVIKANYKLGSGLYYYITFVAEDEDLGSTKFQAFVRYFHHKPTVQFCRFERPPKEEEGYNFKYMMKQKYVVKEEEDPNKPKKPFRAHFWFLQEFRKKFEERYPNASSDAVGHAAGEEWTSMTEAEKAPYVEIAEKKMAEYHKNLEAYNKRLAEGRVGEEESDKLSSGVKDEYVEDERVAGL